MCEISQASYDDDHANDCGRICGCRGFRLRWPNDECYHCFAFHAQLDPCEQCAGVQPSDENDSGRGH